MGSIISDGSVSPSFPATPRSLGASTQQNINRGTGKKAGIAVKEDVELAEANPSRQNPIESALRKEDSMTANESARKGQSMEPSASATSSTMAENARYSENIRSAPGTHAAATPGDSDDGQRKSDQAGVLRELVFSDDDDADNDGDNYNKEFDGVMDFVAVERARIAARHRASAAIGSGEKNKNDGGNTGDEDGKVGIADTEVMKRGDRGGKGLGDGADEIVDDDSNPETCHTRPGLRPALESTAATTPPAGAPWVSPDLGFFSEEERSELDVVSRSRLSSSCDLEISSSSQGSLSSRDAEQGDGGDGGYGGDDGGNDNERV